jgi:hypothetical protein
MINEIKNQHVHAFWGLVSFLILRKLGVDFIFVGLAIGFAVELYQYCFKNEGLKLKDRILDLSFWFIGSLIGFFL